MPPIETGSGAEGTAPFIPAWSASGDHYSPVQLMSFLESDWSPDQLARLDAHLAICDLCPQLLERLGCGSTHDLPDPGVLVGPYKILGQVPGGEGGQGVVMLAEHVAMKHKVAIKLLKSSGPEATEQLLDEARAAARLHHPNIVPVYDIFEWESRAYLVMEYMPGGKLAAPSNSGPAARCRIASDQMATLADAVAYAHQQGVLHRDLKPANVVLDSHGTPRLADFGIAWVVGDLSHETSAAAGTTYYMAPEQVRGNKDEIDQRTDVYGLSAILYELLAGRRPFAGADKASIRKAICAEVPQPLPRNVPKDLAAICLKGLAKKPGDRYQKATILSQDLRNFLVGRPVIARPPYPPRRLGMWARRNRGAALAIGLLTALVAVLGGFARLYANQAERERQLRIAVTKALADVVAHVPKSDPGPTDRQELLASVDPVILLLKQYAPGERETTRLELKAEWARAYLALELKQFQEAVAGFRRLLERIPELHELDRPRIQFLAEVGLAKALVEGEKFDEAGPVIDRILATVREAIGEAMPTQDSVTVYLAAGALVHEAIDRYIVGNRIADAIRVADTYAALPDGPAQADFAAAKRRAENLMSLGQWQFNEGNRPGGYGNLQAAEKLARVWQERRPNDRAAVTLLWRCCVQAGSSISPHPDEVGRRTYLNAADKLEPHADVRSYPAKEMSRAVARFIDKSSKHYFRSEALTPVVHRLEAQTLDAPMPEALGDLLMGYFLMGSAATLEGDALSAKYWNEKGRQLRAKKPSGGFPPLVIAVTANAEIINAKVREIHAVAQTNFVNRVKTDNKFGTGTESLVPRAKFAASESEKEPNQLQRRFMINMAMTMLEAAEMMDYDKLTNLEKDPLLSSLRQEDRFLALIERLKRPKLAPNKSGK